MGVKLCFDTHGHKAFSELHETLHTYLRNTKYKKMLTWQGALDQWEMDYLDNWEPEERYNSYDDYDRYDRYDRYGYDSYDRYW